MIIERGVNMSTTPYNVYVYLPLELLGKDLTEIWDHLYYKLRQDYGDDLIYSNYTGEGCIEDASKVIFVYEFRDFESCRSAVKKCESLEIPYNYFMRYYAPDRID